MPQRKLDQPAQQQEIWTQPLPKIRLQTTSYLQKKVGHCSEQLRLPLTISLLILSFSFLPLFMLYVVPKAGFEPARPVGHYPLKIACLPDSTTSANCIEDDVIVPFRLPAEEKEAQADQPLEKQLLPQPFFLR